MHSNYVVDLFLSLPIGKQGDLVLGDSPGHPFRGNQFTPGGEEHADKVGKVHPSMSGEKNHAQKQAESLGIHKPNFAGQGVHLGHVNNPHHSTIVGNGYHYSHSTGIGTGYAGNDPYVHHTYTSDKNPDLHVGVDARNNKWDVSTSGSGRQTTGSSSDDLDRILKRKNREAAGGAALDAIDTGIAGPKAGPLASAIDTGIAPPPPAPPKGVLDVGGIAGRVGLQPSPDQLPPQIPRHNDPVYREPTKWPKYNGMVNPLNADYSTAGKILRQRLPNLSKDDHVVYGNQHFANAKDMQAQHTALVNKMIKKMGGDPRLPTALQQDKFGPLISGIVSNNFPEKVKNKLRDLSQGSSASKSAGLAHYAAAGKKLDTARAKLQED